ncbi:DUF4255 domain-containing protein [Oscillatoria amoena NRMC-F 0135]|nr:DUF4255 domain-containing protein [Oscillatoria amoena NRMC-F 0135]
MIHSALNFLTQEVNRYLNLKTGGAMSDLAVLTSVANSKGLAIPNKTIGVSLINIEEDRVSKDQQVKVRNTAGGFDNRNPDIYLNLYVLFSANFTNNELADTGDDYIEGLKQLSNIIGFFQSKSVFTPVNSPLMATLAPEIPKLVLELFSFTFEQMNNFWSVVGTNYLPSVLYKVRMITIQENSIEPAGLIENLGIDVAGKN